MLFFQFFAIYLAMWQLTSLLSSDKATLSVEQFIKSISCNKCLIFSLLSITSLTLLSISVSFFNKLLIFIIFSNDVTSLSPTKNLPLLSCQYCANCCSIRSLWNLDVKTNSEPSSNKSSINDAWHSSDLVNADAVWLVNLNLSQFEIHSCCQSLNQAAKACKSADFSSPSTAAFSK